MVGGGSRNELLCQLTADACELPVIAGPVEATAIGNVLVQARAHGMIDGDLAAMRDLVRATQPLREYRPANRSGNAQSDDSPTIASMARAAAVPPNRTRPPVTGRAEAGIGRHDLGPSLSRPAPRPSGGVRLRRWRRRDRDEPAAVARGVRARRVRAERPPRRVHGRHVDDDPRSLVGAAAGLRTNRLHPPDAPRRRTGRRAGRRPTRHPVRPVHARDDLAGGRRGGRPGHRQVVPALPLGRPGCGRRPGAARSGCRIHDPRPDRGYAGRRRTAARRPQRLHDPADALAANPRRTSRFTRAGGSTSSRPSRCGLPCSARPREPSPT